MAAPKHANIGITVGETDLIDVAISYNHFSSLTIERVVSDTANHFNLNVLDNSAFEIEKFILQGNNNIDFHYYDGNNVSLRFNGNITKMSSSFINNRNMLTLEGYVGITSQDKYQLWSRSWNKVVLFPWEQIFDDWPDDTDPSDEIKSSDTRDWWEKVGDFLFGLIGEESYDLEGWSEKANSLIDNNEIYQDEEGQFYTFSKREDMKGEAVVGEEIILPVRPHKILKVIAQGGNLSDIMEFPINKDAYNGCTQFQQTLQDRGNVMVDLLFIRHFLEKYENIKGNGWKYDEKNVTETQLVSVDLSQNVQSDIKYIYDVLLNNSVEKTKSGDFKYNFTFSVDDNKNVHFKPMDISADQEPKKTYTYYGSFNSDDNKSVMTSFSADTNILTAYLTGDMSSLEDMSNLNLVTNEEMTSDILSNQEDQVYSKEGRYKFQFSSKAFAPKKVTNGSQNAESTWKDLWSSAMSQTYKAKATILGNSGLAPGDYVEILVLPRPGLYHHSSGLYYIIKQTDKLENGKMTSELELIKNIATLGQSSLNSKTGGGSAGSGGGGGGGGSF